MHHLWEFIFPESSLGVSARHTHTQSLQPSWYPSCSFTYKECSTNECSIDVLPPITKTGHNYPRMVARAGFRPAAVLTFLLLRLSHLYAIEALSPALPLPPGRLHRQPEASAYYEDVVYHYFEDVYERYLHYANLYEKKAGDCYCLDDGTDVEHMMEQAVLDLQARVQALENLATQAQNQMTDLRVRMESAELEAREGKDRIQELSMQLLVIGNQSRLGTHVDLRVLGKPKEFNGAQERWTTWCFQFESFCGA